MQPVIALKKMFLGSDHAAISKLLVNSWYMPKSGIIFLGARANLSKVLSWFSVKWNFPILE
jgi:hypothetical protein